jgi:threonine/homoserine/homoserine lactone efflux protein
VPADLLPLALAIAASPFPVVPAILLLFTARPRATTAGFLTGWFVGVTAATTTFALLAEVVELADEPPTWASWTRVVLGLLLVVLGAREWLTRGADPKQPAWMAGLDTAVPSSALRLGLLLSAANPKIIVLAAAGGIVIGSAGLAVASAIGATVAFALVASVTVAGPLLAYLVAGERALGLLGHVRAWLQRNSTAVMAIVLVLIGLALVSAGVSGL